MKEELPKPGTVVSASIKHYSTGEIVDILLRRVDEPDCIWRVYEGDGYESEFNEMNWDVIGWTD